MSEPVLLTSFFYGRVPVVCVEQQGGKYLVRAANGAEQVFDDLCSAECAAEDLYLKLEGEKCRSTNS